MWKPTEAFDNSKMLTGIILQQFILCSLIGEPHAFHLIFEILTVHQRHI
tara:strand:- start:1030 stop:1176 length:147 start_codon:yes stop_codon:yes gene_type:complete